MSAMLMAGATIATAWSAYQSSNWNSDYASHKARAATAVVRAGSLTNHALHRTSIHVNLFVQWASAASRNDRALADFLFARFPEPLKTAATTWRGQGSGTDLSAPASPFDLPEYVLPEQSEADRWEHVAESETSAADRANDIARRYLLFTIVFASALFFAGISGKFRWAPVDVGVLALGAVTLLIGVMLMLAQPWA